VEIKCHLDATDVFTADLISCSTCFGHHYAHHQELEIIYRCLLPVVFGALVFKLSVRCGAEGCVSSLRAAARRPDTHVEQAIRSAIKTSVGSRWHFISPLHSIYRTPSYTYVKMTNKLHNLLSNLFQSNYPLHVSNKYLIISSRSFLYTLHTVLWGV
jgi:hypothetical protein